MMSFPSGDLLMDIILWIWGIGIVVGLVFTMAGGWR